MSGLLSHRDIVVDARNLSLTFETGDGYVEALLAIDLQIFDTAAGLAGSVI